VNIAQMVVGRLADRPGGDAIGVLNLDSIAPQEALDEILKHSDISWAKTVRLPKRHDVPEFLV
jgi:D-3-phosphoglycerate dehydrogenase